MSHFGVRYDKATGYILGVYDVVSKSDLALNFNPETEGMVEPPVDHPVYKSQRDWSCPGGVLTYDPKPEPVREPQPGAEEFIEVLLDETNVLRQRAGLPPLSMTDITDKAKAKLRAKG